MNRSNFFILIVMVVGIGMVIRTFFGGSDESEDNIGLQDEQIGFVNELEGTGNNQNTGDNIGIGTEIDIEDDEKDYIEIRVMMPRYFYNNERKKFAQDLFDEKKIYIKFIFIDDLNNYRDQLFIRDFSGTDLALFPYDRKEKFSTRSFTVQQDIQPYFDQLLYGIVKGNQTSFLPFSADPMIMYVMSGYEGQNNFYEISEYVLNRKPLRTLSFPLFFGISSEDFEKGRGFSWEYQDIVRYAIMHYFTTNNDSHDLQTWVDSNVLQNYNVSDLKTIRDIITTADCNYFPSLCFQIFNFVGIRFGFLSDADIVNQYLHNKKSDFSAIMKFMMPFAQLESPVRIRGRGIPALLENPEIINGVYAFLIKYMSSYGHYNLRNSTLPVFNVNTGNGLLGNQYIGLRGYIMREGGDYIKTLEGMSKFQELIEYKITAKEYLR